jgi:hypothetical protein
VRRCDRGETTELKCAPFGRREFSRFGRRDAGRRRPFPSLPSLATRPGDIPERLAPYEGKVALLRRLGASISVGQGSSLPTLFVWHRPDLSEFVACRLEDWVEGSREAFGLGTRAFASLIGGLPEWDGGQTHRPRESTPPLRVIRRGSRAKRVGGTLAADSPICVRV